MKKTYEAPEVTKVGELKELTKFDSVGQSYVIRETY